MELKIRVYLTTTRDPVSNLDTIQSFRQLEKWKEDVKPHALEILEYDALELKILSQIAGKPVRGCYAVVAHPGGGHQEHEVEQMLSANKVGAGLLKFLKDNSKKIIWDIKEPGTEDFTVDEITRKLPTPDLKSYWDNFTYGLISDDELDEDTYEIDLEFVLADGEKSGEDNQGTDPKASP